ncbi:MAG: hypothetical protein ISS15_13960 [Alphaproteobacteria bacterium]|nr:hypothetical protein [Alphaproteobacteria bacterium]MBL7098759.1 hypothetical protein [Alphaproteobacteria bacterium]
MSKIGQRGRTVLELFRRVAGDQPAALRHEEIFRLLGDAQKARLGSRELMQRGLAIDVGETLALTDAGLKALRKLPV